MNFRVIVQPDPMTFGYRFWIISEGQGSYALNAEGYPTHKIEPNVTLSDIPATFAIGGEAAHALLGALARELGAVEHPEQLRKDYEHERGRVDRLIGHLMGGHV